MPYQCRIPHCDEIFEWIGRLFLHESEHEVDLPEICENARLYSVSKYNQARAVAVRQTKGICQHPNCEKFEPNDNLEAHHTYQANHPDYLILVCAEHHGLLEAEPPILNEDGLHTAPLTEFGPLEPVDE